MDNGALLGQYCIVALLTVLTHIMEYFWNTFLFNNNYSINNSFLGLGLTTQEPPNLNIAS
jgi:hypothetical protein